MKEPRLELRGVRAAYDRVDVLHEVSLTVGPGEIVTLLGANGAGKTTTLRAISGLLRPRAGEIRIAGESLQGLRAHEIVRQGISCAPEGRRLFATLTVDENLDLGAFSLGRDPDQVTARRRRVFELFPRLAERRRQLAGTLSGGEQQMLAIGRALMCAPRVLLLDEPSLGLAPLLVRTIFDIIREIHRSGVSILLVEQNARAALRLAQRGYVLENGRVTLSGPSEELLADERVRRAYLGER